MYNKAIICSRPGEFATMGYVGVFLALEEKKILSSIKTWVCPSVTSFISVMIKCGYKCSEIINIMFNNPELLINMSSFKNLKNIGISNTRFKSLVSRLILNKLNVIPSLQEMKNNYDVNFVTIGFSLDKQLIEYINYETYPNITILDLICISYSVPGIYEPYSINNNIWIDGSLIESTPKCIYSSNDSIFVKSNSVRIDVTNNFSNILRSVFEYREAINITPDSNVKIVYVSCENQDSVEIKIANGYKAVGILFAEETKENS